jgi:hypothetical protein
VLTLMLVVGECAVFVSAAASVKRSDCVAGDAHGRYDASVEPRELSVLSEISSALFCGCVVVNTATLRNMLCSIMQPTLTNKCWYLTVTLTVLIRGLKHVHQAD